MEFVNESYGVTVRSEQQDRDDRESRLHSRASAFHHVAGELWFYRVADRLRYSGNDSHLLMQETTSTPNAFLFSSILVCESFSQPVSLQLLGLARDKLNQELRRDVSTISAQSKHTLEQ